MTKLFLNAFMKHKVYVLCLLITSDTSDILSGVVPYCGSRWYGVYSLHKGMKRMEVISIISEIYRDPAVQHIQKKKSILKASLNSISCTRSLNCS